MAAYVTLREPYAEASQQRQADFLGMYVFLATETMIFGGLLSLVFAYRLAHPQASAEAARHLKIWIATGNTALLMTSSLCVALAVIAARAGSRRAVLGWLAAAAALGCAFLGLKGWEYLQDLQEGLSPLGGPSSPLRATPAALFIDLYYGATALHALHLTAGLGLLAWAMTRVAHGTTRLPQQAVVVEMTGLYWHFVDVVWVFLFPIFYLARG